jgi:hypothetical protein
MQEARRRLPRLLEFASIDPNLRPTPGLILIHLKFESLPATKVVHSGGHKPPPAIPENPCFTVFFERSRRLEGNPTLSANELSRALQTLVTVSSAG